MDRNETESLALQARIEARRAEHEAAQRRLEHDQHLTDRRITAHTERLPPAQDSGHGGDGL